jgi:hypothetical protein
VRAGRDPNGDFSAAVTSPLVFPGEYFRRQKVDCFRGGEDVSLFFPVTVDNYRGLRRAINSLSSGHWCWSVPLVWQRRKLEAFRTNATGEKVVWEKISNLKF